MREAEELEFTACDFYKARKYTLESPVIDFVKGDVFVKSKSIPIFIEKGHSKEEIGVRSIFSYHPVLGLGFRALQKDARGCYRCLVNENNVGVLFCEVKHRTPIGCRCFFVFPKKYHQVLQLEGLGMRIWTCKGY